MSSQPAARVVSEAQLEAFSARLLVAAGAEAGDASSVARSLVWADLHGRPAQGVARLPVLIQMLKHGLIESPASMSWREPSGVINHLDAGGAGRFCGCNNGNRVIVRQGREVDSGMA